MYRASLSKLFFRKQIGHLGERLSRKISVKSFSSWFTVTFVTLVEVFAFTEKSENNSSKLSSDLDALSSLEVSILFLKSENNSTKVSSAFDLLSLF